MKNVEEREAFTLNNKGEKIFGILHRPQNIKKAHPILFCQGFEGNKCGKNRIYVTLAQELAKSGFVVARFDYRGSGDSEGDPSQLTITDKVDDTKKVLEFLSNDPRIDPSRMGIFGRSLGGAIGVLSASGYPNIKSMVLWAPVFNGRQWKELWALSKSNPSDVNIDNELKKIPGEIPNEQFLKELFQLDLATSLKSIPSAALLHIHGEKDSVVKIDHADAYNKACQNFEKAKFIRLPNTDHDFALSSERPIALRETVEWFKNTL